MANIVEMTREARKHLRGIARETPLEFNEGLSARFGAKIYLKREDLQPVRSYKVRGAYNCMRTLSPTEKKRGIVCASAGNHAQGVAFSCAKLKVRGTICMPQNTPRQKVDRVASIGGTYVAIRLVGDTFDEASAIAQQLAKRKGMTFIHPFDDPLVIAGQGTVAAEILEQLKVSPDYVILPAGGGGLIAGSGTFIKATCPSAKIVGVEASGAAGLDASLKAGKVVTLAAIDTFVDGSAVKTIGTRTFRLAQKVVDSMIVVPEGKVCEVMIDLYQRDGIVAEPAGALSIAALDSLGEKLKGKTVVCVVSGGNNDISRYPEIVERALVYRGLKHYFIINFSQRPGALRRLLDEALGPTDDITLFEYTKKNNRESGPALIGVELAKREDLKPLLKRMDAIGISYELLPPDSSIFRFLI